MWSYFKMSWLPYLSPSTPNGATRTRATPVGINQNR